MKKINISVHGVPSGNMMPLTPGLSSLSPRKNGSECSQNKFWCCWKSKICSPIMEFFSWTSAGFSIGADSLWNPDQSYMEPILGASVAVGMTLFLKRNGVSDYASLSPLFLWVAGWPLWEAFLYIFTQT